MAGSSDPVDPKVPPAKPSRPRIKTFSCQNCGASVTIRNAGASLSVACESCQAILDVTDENYRIISKLTQVIKDYTPRFTLGTRGKIFGKEWEISGFILRQDVGSGYSWEEYLLFNPYYGYRWLLQDRGHWNFVTPTKRKPHINAATSRGVNYLGKHYKLFNMGHATVRWVIGEFYWKVKVDRPVEMTDYVCPPEMLSCEKDENEINWAISEYVEPTVIGKAFKSAYSMPVRVGIGANQPSPAAAIFKAIAPFWGIFLCLILVIQVWALSKSSNETAMDKTFLFVTNAKRNDITSPVFNLSKDHANVEINVRATVDNTWFYVAGELVDDQTGTSYPFEKSIEYYHGYEGGESWSEGSTHDRLWFSNVPGGKYYLNMDTESGGFSPPQGEREFTITVLRDVPYWWSFWWCALAVSILPAWFWLKKRTTEVARWSNSDYSPYVSSSD